MIKLKPLNRRYTKLLIAAGVFFANVVTIWVLDTNLRNRVYPTHQDAIMVDIVMTLWNSMFILLPALLSVSLSRRHLLLRITARVLMFIAALYAFALSGYWWYTDHYPAGAAFIPVLLICLWALWIPSPSSRELAQ